MKVRLKDLDVAIGRIIETVSASDYVERVAEINVLEERGFFYPGLPPADPIITARSFRIKAERVHRGAPWCVELDYEGIANEALNDRRKADFEIAKLKREIEALKVERDAFRDAYESTRPNAFIERGY